MRYLECDGSCIARDVAADNSDAARTGILPSLNFPSELILRKSRGLQRFCRGARTRRKAGNSPWVGCPFLIEQIPAAVAIALLDRLDVGHHNAFRPAEVRMGGVGTADEDGCQGGHDQKRQACDQAGGKRIKATESSLHVHR